MARKTNTTINGIDYYNKTINLGYNADGKRIRKNFYGKSKKEVDIKIDQYLDGIKLGLNFDYDEYTLSQSMGEWIYHILRVDSKIKASTFERYEGIYRNYIKNSDIGTIKLIDLKSSHLQQYYNTLFENGKSSNIIFNTNKILKIFVNFCIDNDYIKINICSGRRIAIPQKDLSFEDDENDKIEFFTPEEIEKIKAVKTKNKQLMNIIIFSIGTGLRQGETLALKWSDIYGGEVNVNKSIRPMYTIANDGTRQYSFLTTTPKTKTSIRKVPLPLEIEKMLEKHKADQINSRIPLEIPYNNDNYIFSTVENAPLDAHNLRRSYKKIIDKAEVPYRKFHALRHTYATLLFQAGVPLKTVQTLLGHSSIYITADIYTHVMKCDKIEAIDVLNAFLKSNN